MSLTEISIDRYEGERKLRKGFLVSERRLVTEALIWLGLPTFLFLAFWLRPIIAIPSALLLVIALFLRIRRPAADFHASGYRSIRTDWRYWICLAAVALMVLFTGIGGLVPQFGGDHIYRNALFYDLVRRPWPVTYDPVMGDPVTLCYYFGFWLPPALAGKLTGLILPGDIAQALYAFWGMWIFFRFLFSRFGGRATWISLLVPIGFAALDPIIAILSTWLLPFRVKWELGYLVDLASEYYSLPSLNVLLFYVYNQGIGALVAFMLIRHEWRRPRMLLLIYSLMLIMAPYPALGLFPLMTLHVLRNIRAFLTWENLFGIAIAIIIALFFSGNAAQSASGMIPLSLGPLLLTLVIFLSFSYGVWLVGLWPWLRRNLWFWMTAVTAIIVPMFMSSPNHQDIGFRITVPSMIVMMLAAIMAFRSWRHLPKWRKIWLGVVFAIGCYTPLQVYCIVVDRNIRYLEGEKPAKLIWMLGKLDNPVYDDCRVNFVIERETFFTRYLMRRDTMEPVAPETCVCSDRNHQ